MQYHERVEILRAINCVGASILLGRIAIGDWLTVLMGVASLAVLFRWKVSNPLPIARNRGGWPHRIPAAATGLGHGQIRGSREPQRMMSATVFGSERRRDDPLRREGAPAVFCAIASFVGEYAFGLIGGQNEAHDHAIGLGRSSSGKPALSRTRLDFHQRAVVTGGVKAIVVVVDIEAMGAADGKLPVLASARATSANSELALKRRLM